MQKVTILCTGKLKEKFYLDAAAEYVKRLSRFCKLEIIELPEEKIEEKNASVAVVKKALEKEGKAILSNVRKGAAIVAMCIEGKMMSSEDFSHKLEGFALEGKSTVNLIIGSSYGLSDRVKSAAHLRLSMSPMTFPHQLARVMLLEQLYRAMSISANGKYHK